MRKLSLPPKFLFLACRIWDAFNAHGIACGARPTCTQ
jgi:hypothetical protein